MAERFKTRYGEVDIIARKGPVITFVEVKQRSTQKAIDESITSQAENRIMASSEIWVERHFDTLPKDFELRFDFAAILGEVSPFCKIQYLENAFYCS